MSNLPKELKYTPTHEWVMIASDGTATIGITDHAQGLLGDIVFIELPEMSRQVAAGEECAVIESVKAASDIYSPLSGEIIETNNDLSDTPELVNQHPYGDGWIFRIRLDDRTELDDLLDAAAYQAQVEAEEH
ncbi:MAG: glycine cleavage system protein H [Gammaproteobacteria bacterium RBG_16_57_12]|nr:MAG: glycine cleavage system protein H [Gammaproteobacteria bacterium RBG_16_57_12]